MPVTKDSKPPKLNFQGIDKGTWIYEGANPITFIVHNTSQVIGSIQYKLSPTGEPNQGNAIYPGAKVLLNVTELALNVAPGGNPWSAEVTFFETLSAAAAAWG